MTWMHPTIYCVFSVLWRQENAMQQAIASTREEVSKKEQALRSITGKVSVVTAARVGVYTDI